MAQCVSPLSWGYTLVPAFCAAHQQHKTGAKQCACSRLRHLRCEIEPDGVTDPGPACASRDLLLLIDPVRGRNRPAGGGIDQCIEERHRAICVQKSALPGIGIGPADDLPNSLMPCAELLPLNAIVPRSCMPALSYKKA